MKIAYVTRTTKSLPGVLTKIQEQIASWEKLGNTVAPFFITTDGEPLGSFAPWKHANLLNPYRKLIRSLHTFNPDLVYLRSIPSGALALSLLHHFGDKTVLEINSFATRERSIQTRRSMRDRASTIINNALQPITLSKTLGLVCVTRELSEAAEYSAQPRKMVAPNGINLSCHPTLKTARENSKIIIAFMGTPGKIWHGTDKLIDLSLSLGENFEVHVIGQNEPVHQPNTEKNRTPSNIIFHGFKDINGYTKILKNAHICIASTALHRIGMNEACPLKTREYIATGFPVILPYIDTVFINKKPDWILEIPNTETTFKDEKTIRKIKEFCEFNHNKIVTHEESEPYIDIIPLEHAKISRLKDWITHK
ncbi:hypothetical protein DA2_2020 [Desulfovibrio sp. A2]|nr:hypothetical protein DA2_2020 [Desulfovibrio sp. A2]